MIDSLAYPPFKFVLSACPFFLCLLFTFLGFTAKSPPIFAAVCVTFAEAFEYGFVWFPEAAVRVSDFPERCRSVIVMATNVVEPGP